MSKNRKGIDSGTIFVVSIFVCLGSFFGTMIAFACGGITAGIVLGVIFVITLIPVVVILIKDHIADKKIDKESSKRTTTSTGSYSYTPPPKTHTRKVGDDFLNSVDEYVAREFPNLPFDDIGRIVEQGNKSTQEWANQVVVQMQKHLGLKYQIITVKLFDGSGDKDKTKKEAGSFRRTGLITADIMLDSSLSYFMMLACLAHEMAHAYQSFNGKQPYEDGCLEEEQFTDLLTFYLGFTKIVKNGYYGYNSKLGYVDDGDFLKIEEIYSKRTSSPSAFAKEKAELTQLSQLYERMVQETIDMCDQLLTKYLPPDDKTFVLNTKEHYSSNEEKAKIKQYQENIEKRSKDSLNLDITGLEIRLEELLKAKEKLVRIYNFIFAN